MIKKLFKIAIVLILVFICLTTAKYLWDKKHYVSLNLNYSESTNTLMNPERGWYLINSFMVKDSFNNTDMASNFIKQYSEGDRLALLLFNISNYKDKEISHEGLNYINNVLVDLGKAGMKGIVRFIYDWDGKGVENEPDNIEMVLRHIEQLTPILHTNKDVIYLLQGILVGSYGEMHGSKFLNEENVDTLLNKLLAAADESTYLSVRTPEYWRRFSKSPIPLKSFSSQPQARLGLYNDGLLSSDTDLGTYSDGTEENNSVFSKWERSKELEFQAALCKFVPNGGEFAIESEYNNIERVVEEFPSLHISYLNRGYNAEVLNKLKNSVYITKDPKDPYSGMDGYKYIQDHIGYRFVLREVSVPSKIYKGKVAEIKVKIENTGFANVYYKKNVALLLKQAATGKVTSIPVNQNVRTWNPGALTQLDIKIPAKFLNSGTYKIYLKISDTTQVIEMANNGIFDLNLMANSIGEIQVADMTIRNIWRNPLNIHFTQKLVQD